MRAAHSAGEMFSGSPLSTSTPPTAIGEVTCIAPPTACPSSGRVGIARSIGLGWAFIAWPAIVVEHPVSCTANSVTTAISRLRFIELTIVWRLLVHERES